MLLVNVKMEAHVSTTQGHIPAFAFLDLMGRTVKLVEY